jgi:hypothetical protein
MRLKSGLELSSTAVPPAAIVTVSFAGSLGPVAFARSFLNGYTALGISVTMVAG